MHHEANNRYHGGKQLSQAVRVLAAVSERHCALACARGKPPDEHVSAFLAFADAKQAKHPIEPKAVPRSLGAYSVWKDTHVFVLLPENAPHLPIVTVSEGARGWLAPQHHGVAAEHEVTCSDGDGGERAVRFQMHHFSLSYFWAEAQRMEPSERRASVTVMLVGQRVCVTLLACVFAAISPNRTHVTGCVTADHWLCRAPELLRCSVVNGGVVQSREDLASVYGLEFTPRSYHSAKKRRGGVGKRPDDATASVHALPPDLLRRLTEMSRGGEWQAPGGGGAAQFGGVVGGGGGAASVARMLLSEEPASGGLESAHADGGCMRNSRRGGGSGARMHPYARSRPSESAPLQPHAPAPAVSPFASAFPGLASRSSGLSSLATLQHAVTQDHFRSLLK